MNNKHIKENFVEISGIFLENGILNILYENEIKEENKKNKRKEKKEESKEENKELKERILQYKKCDIEKINLINFFYNMNNNKKPNIKDIEKLEKYLTKNEQNDFLRIKTILYKESDNLNLIKKRRLRRWKKHRIKRIYKSLIEREMKKLNLNNRIIRKEKFNSNKTDKRKKKKNITEINSKFRIDNYERIGKYKYKNNPVYISVVAYDNLANYLYRKNLKGKRARIQGRLINYYNNNNKYIGNYVEINKIKIY